MHYRSVTHTFNGLSQQWQQLATSGIVSGSRRLLKPRIQNRKIVDVDIVRFFFLQYLRCRVMFVVVAAAAATVTSLHLILSY